ncbi:barstar family protein [Glycomyces sp. NRRL B-16210]|uniref:barstar family protein n=1 Tax=Glycomyces sp. NRRL B-16210 TaxID=1463821 RepID=UPI00068AA020|nr:barstar family protein [Glycomyces sp. NRRL B-16210]
MDLRSLTERRPPWVVFTRTDDPWLEAEAEHLQSAGGHVIRFDGRRLLEPSQVFSAFDEAMSLPDYFGRNWDALADCLHDWHAHGFGSKEVAILIDHADELASKAFLGTFVAVLCQAAWQANLRLDSDGNPDEHLQPFTMHTVFLLDIHSPATLTEIVGSTRDVETTVRHGRLLASLDATAWPSTARDDR